MERKDVYNFAVKWNEKFRDPDIDYIELVDHYLAYGAAEILSMHNRSWFIIALNRLAELCKDEQEK